jgi:hypothetical protein
MKAYWGGSIKLCIPNIRFPPPPTLFFILPLLTYYISLPDVLPVICSIRVPWAPSASLSLLCGLHSMVSTDSLEAGLEQTERATVNVPSPRARVTYRTNNGCNKPCPSYELSQLQRYTFFPRGYKNQFTNGKVHIKSTEECPSWEVNSLSAMEPFSQEPP